MVHAPSVLTMILSPVHTPFSVRIGLMKMESRTTRFMVCLTVLLYQDQCFCRYLAWTNMWQKMIVAYSAVPIFQVRLPAGDDQTSIVHLLVQIRDQLDCITELNISSVIVIADTMEMTNLIKDIQSSSGGNTSNPLVQLLASGNQNIVGQVLTSVSQQFNRMNEEIIDRAVSSQPRNHPANILMLIVCSF